MNHTLENPVGIDEAIHLIQEELYSLAAEWGVSLIGYPRVLVTEGKAEYEKDGEYTEVYYDDSTAGTFFFIEDTSHKTSDGLHFNASLRIVFMLNLRTIGLYDSKVHKAVLSKLNECWNISVESLEKGVQNALKGLDTECVKFEDVRPNHTFAVNVKTGYQFNC